jgi:hypothetical protein
VLAVLFRTALFEMPVNVADDLAHVRSVLVRPVGADGDVFRAS